jgi:hypothetical protein
MAELERDSPPDSKWFWILLLIALFVVTIFWFANPLGVGQHASPAAQASDTVPTADGSSIPLTLPTTPQ